MIKVENLTKRFGEITAADGVSFEVNSGEILGLLGPNGAGKTTTINMLVGVQQPDSGKIELDGVGNPLDKDVRKLIGNAPQSLAIYEDLTAEENLRFFGRLYGITGKNLNVRVKWALSFSGLTERKNDKAKTYSGGMKRRLNLACALIHDPPFLLLDEPTVGVDPQSRNHIFESIEKLHSDGRTIIYTTHYMEEAQRLCDRVAIIDKGKILALDTVNGLLDSYGGLSVINVKLESLPEKPLPVDGNVDGNNLRIETEKPLEELAKLSGSGLKFLELSVDRADLETVFLNLTGRRLRDR
ncbi:MAG: ATP-binding cassette domain-containing protein [candidate division Zixibacteria bacterium]|nr:ATP-binding cassette domain-containing protein [candidate division Zixibacteria bacterium]